MRFLRHSGPINYVDVGASVGDVAGSVDTHFGIGRGLFVEPQPERCQQLVERFPAPRFSVHQCALSDRSETCTMDVLNWHYSSSLLPVRRDLPNVSTLLDLDVRQKIECQLTTLDQLMAEHWKDGVIDLMKIDVQGAELMVLRGAAKTLKRVRFVLTEVSFIPMYEASCGFEELHGFLREHGFRLLAMEEGFRGKDGELLQCDALFKGRD